MDFIEYMKETTFSSDLGEAARPHPLTSVKGAAGIAGGRSRRQADRQESRARQRELRFCSNRSLEPPPPAPVPPPEDPSAALLRRLKQWQVEKHMKRQAAPKPQPPFKVGRAPSKFPPPPPPPVHRRETRASRRAALTAVVPKHSFPPLAPIGARFHPPKNMKLTPKGFKTASFLSPQKFNIFSKFSTDKTKSITKIPKKNSKSAIRKNKSSKTEPTEPSDKWKISEQKLVTPVSTEKSENFFVSPVAQENVDKVVTPVSSAVGEVQVSSPFVTLTRGKNKFSSVDLEDIKSTSEMSPQFFRLQLDGEISRLNDLCDTWKHYQENNLELSEDHNDMINVAIGQTQLLIRKKFQQFRGLIDRCESQAIVEGEGIVGVDDLRGFWDMIYMQVENLDIRFKELVELKTKNWKEESNNTPSKNKKSVKQKKIFPKRQTKSSGLKAMIQAARLKNGHLNKLQHEDNDENLVTFDAKFFSVTSPVKNFNEEKMSALKSMHKSVVTSEMKKKNSSTPLNVNAIIAVASAEKRWSEMFEKMSQIDLNKTPGKSILKTPGTNKKTISEKNVKIICVDENNETILDSKLDIKTENVLLSNEKRRQTHVLEPYTLIDDNENFKKSERKKKLDNNLPEESAFTITPILQMNSHKPLKEITPNVNRILRHSGSNSNTKSKRISYNLISFDSPCYSVPVTRSAARKLSQLFADEQ